MIHFIVTCPQVPYEFNLEVPDDSSFLTIKSLIYDECKVQVGEEVFTTNVPVISTSGYSDKKEHFIDEEKELKDYNMQNGGQIFIHFLAVENFIE